MSHAVPEVCAEADRRSRSGEIRARCSSGGSPRGSGLDPRNSTLDAATVRQASLQPACVVGPGPWRAMAQRGGVLARSKRAALGERSWRVQERDGDGSRRGRFRAARAARGGHGLGGLGAWLGRPQRRPDGPECGRGQPRERSLREGPRGRRRRSGLRGGDDEEARPFPVPGRLVPVRRLDRFLCGWS